MGRKPWKEIDIYTMRQHDREMLRKAMAEILGFPMTRISELPEPVDGAVASLFLGETDGNYPYAVHVVMYEPAVAWDVRREVDLVRPLARRLCDEMICSAEGLRHIRADSPLRWFC